MLLLIRKINFGKVITREWAKNPLSNHYIGKILEVKVLAKRKIKDLAVEIIMPFLEENGLELFNIEFIKEGKEKYLRVYIDKLCEDDGICEYVSIEDCEKVSRFLSEKLDEADPIEENYYLEVSSPGLDRPLLREEDYIKYKGKLVDVGLYKAINGSKQLTGELIGLKEGIVSITGEDGKVIDIPLDQITKTKLAVVF